MAKRRRLIIALFIFAFVLTACSSFNSFIGSSPTSTPAVNIPLSEAEVHRVSVEDAFAAYTAGSAIFVDVRSQSAYDKSHIPGARTIQLGEFEVNMAKIDLPKDEWIITYCTWLSEHTSARAAFLMLNNGYTNVTPILGGFGAWVDAGYPTEP